MVSPWEKFQGMGTPLDIDTLIAKLQAIRTESGDIPVDFRNYLEENVIAPCTSLNVDKGHVVLCSEDTPETEGLDA